MINEKYGRLRVISERIVKNYKKMALCLCDCGNEKEVLLDSLKRGHTNSCGCLRSETTAQRKTKHGLVQHPLYHLRRDIINRCYNNKVKAYKNYGGRGISVYVEWLKEPATFVKWGIENGWCKGLQIDRINNNGNYEPENCRFVTQKVNARNRRNSHNLTFDGVTMNLAEWANKTGIHYKLLYKRIKYQNLSIGEAINLKSNYTRKAS